MALSEAILHNWKLNPELITGSKDIKMIVKHLKRDVKDVSDLLAQIDIEGLDEEEKEEE